LVAFVFQITSTQANRADQRTAQLAARLYLALLQKEGSDLYNVYNATVFGSVVRILKNSVKRAVGADDADDKVNEEGNTSQAGGSQKEEEEEEEETGEADNMEVVEDKPASSGPVNAQLLPLFTAFTTFLASTKLLADQVDLLSQIADFLTSAVEDIRDFEAKRGATLPDASAVKATAFEALGNLLASAGRNGLGQTLAKVFKGLLPVLLLMRRGTQPQTVPKSYIPSAQLATAFVTKLTQGPINKQHGEVFEEKIFILLQHICIRVPERVEHRAHAAVLLVSLSGHLTDTQLEKFASWLKKFTKNSRASYRLFGSEILGDLFQSNTFCKRTLEGEASIFTDHRQIFNSLFSRVHDKSPA